jgi:glycosyltransferase 2 family protein
MKATMAKKSYWIGFVVSVFFLFLFFRNIDLGQLWQNFKRVNYVYTIPLMLLNLFSIWLRSKRWGYLLHPIKKVPMPDLFNATAIGFMANNIFPARIGEFIRAIQLGHRARISKTTSFATIVVERLFDGFTVLALLLAVSLFMPFPASQSSLVTPRTIRSAGLLSFGFYAFILLILLLLRFKNPSAYRFLAFLLKWLPSRISQFINSTVESFVSGLEILQKGKDIFIIIFYSLAVWLLTSFSVYLLFWGFHLSLSWWAAVFIEVVLVFVVTLPSAPGYIGTFHWACAAGMMYLGVDRSAADGFAVVLWMAGFVPVTGLGLILLWKEGLSLRVLQRGEE